MFTVLGVLTSLLSLQRLKVLYKDRKLLMPHQRSFIQLNFSKKMPSKTCLPAEFMQVNI